MDEFSLTMEEINLLALCRKILHGLMKLKWGDQRPYCSDGTLRIVFPDYAEEISGESVYIVELFTCTLGRHHKYDWDGSTLEIALSRLKYQLEQWVQES